MRNSIFIFLVFLFGFNSKSEINKEKINVLFIGNSLTYYHDMPKILQEMLDESNPNYNIEQSTFPGMALDSHLNDIIFKRDGDDISTRNKELGEITETEKKLSEKKWDIVILQENPGYLYFPEVVDEIVNPSIKRIKQLTNNPDCKFILFTTSVSYIKYPIKKVCVPKMNFKYVLGDKDKFCSVDVQNIEEDMKILNETFYKIAKENSLISTNHCNLNYKVQTEYPKIKLYEADGHPSEAGSFFSACIFYKILTNSKPSKLKYYGNLNFKDSKILKKMAS
ncbi:DUF4886 domain-containing protein [Flavobacterium sp.]|uniref:DUF4886 domain-containing protein n=1 Tax=Flavobacterium sp. TaxID=239 RepID=UPI00374CCB1C